MFKKVVITVSSAILALSLIGAANAADELVTKSLTTFKAGTHYQTLSNAKSPEKEVIEIFSFNCPACFNYQEKLRFPEKIKENLPKDVKFTQYHFTPFGKLGPELSTAWAIANVLGNQEKVLNAIFNGIHVKHNINSEADIINVFKQLGVSEEEYKNLKNDFLVKAFLKKQEDVVKSLPVPYLPTFYVNGKYRIEISAVRTNSDDVYVESNLNLISQLLKK